MNIENEVAQYVSSYNALEESYQEIERLYLPDKLLEETLVAILREKERMLKNCREMLDEYTIKQMKGFQNVG